jgi:hypothetical protein
MDSDKQQFAQKNFIKQQLTSVWVWIRGQCARRKSPILWHKSALTPSAKSALFTTRANVARTIYARNILRREGRASFALPSLLLKMSHPWRTSNYQLLYASCGWKHPGRLIRELLTLSSPLLNMLTASNDSIMSVLVVDENIHEDWSGNS